ncbi:hypothetical protein PVA45_00185 [Entomospira entomophila]|uniref:Uncharacterized protein n=1 Tax=Entomospira entomophila TaxID=2719988 RepID=A0A968GAQ9_9SPIO|nr:hypothetical protein [Entomospira entomophilus]NIZ39941.1 hypothetical protein [Entomospira entomophilus]WDI35502.1 hypothetical protein PVA45_00185 [Entomospira entomophilus]
MAWFSKGHEDAYKDKVAMIYQEYANLRDYISNAKELEEGFYQRHKDMLRSTLDMNTFLDGEYKHVQELMQQYQKKRKEAQEAHLRKQQAQSVLEAEIDRLANGYKGYPISPFVSISEFPELSHLYGAIQHFESTQWYRLLHQLRTEYALLGSNILIELEQEITKIVPQQSSQEPQALLLLNQSMRNQPSMVEQYAMEAMKEVAFFVNDVKNLLESVNYPTDAEAYMMVHKIIQDFRLTQIKRANH